MTTEDQEVAAKASSVREEFASQFGLVLETDKSKIKAKNDSGLRVKQPDGTLIDKTVTLETIKVPVYATLDEAKSGLGEAKCLELINSQNRTNLMNAARVKYTGKTSNAAYEAEANAKIWATPDLMAQAQAIYTDQSTNPQQKAEKYSALMDTVIAQIKQAKAQGGAQADESQAGE